MENKKRLGMDLDGTIAKDNPVLRDVTYFYLSDDAIIDIYAELGVDTKITAKLRQYRKDNWMIYIYTARDERFREVTKKWLKTHRVPYDVLLMNKPYFTKYVGDEVEEIENFKK